MNTVFQINGKENIQVAGTGQETVTAILKANRNKKVVLKGFVDNKTNTFTPINF